MSARTDGTPPEATFVLEALDRTFDAPHKPELDPLDELVLTILSQSTTDANRDRAWDRLVERFPTEVEPSEPTAPLVDWALVHQLPLAELEDLVRVAGLGAQKAASIHAALQRLISEIGGPSLDHLRDMTDATAIDYLSDFRGVGVKTAACVLCFSLRRDVLPVDTHVLRIGRRLGWLPPKASATRAHDLLAARVAPADRFRMHMLLITFGRATCRARKPACSGCPLSGVCPKVGVPD